MKGEELPKPKTSLDGRAREEGGVKAMVVASMRYVRSREGLLEERLQEEGEEKPKGSSGMGRGTAKVLGVAFDFELEEG